MAMKKSRRTSVYGWPGSNNDMFPAPIVGQRDPLSNDGGEIGQVWINTDTNAVFTLTSFNSSGEAVWTNNESAGSTFSDVTITGGAGNTVLEVQAGDVEVTNGDLSISGETNSGTLLAGDTSITGTLDVTGDTQVSNLTVTGDLVAQGDFDISSAEAYSFTTTSNTDPAFTILANGGTSEAILIQSAQGTAADSIQLDSVAGGVTLSAGLAGTAITLDASDAAGGISVSAGTGGLLMDLANGDFDLETGTGDINIGVDAAAHTITVGNITGATAVVNNTGTGGFEVNTTGAGDIDLNSAAGVSIDAADASNFTVSGAALDLTLESTAGSVNINAGEAVADAVAIDASAGGFTLDGVLTSGITVTGASEDLNLTATGGSINVSASEAAADAVVIEASNAAGGVQINANGLVAVAPDAASVASPTASSTQNFRVIQATFTGFTTASSSSQDFTIASDQILATSACLVQVTNLNASTNDAIMTMDGVTQAAGSLVVHTTNNGAGALGAGDDVIITAWIIS